MSEQSQSSGRGWTALAGNSMPRGRGAPGDPLDTLTCATHELYARPPTATRVQESAYGHQGLHPFAFSRFQS